MTLFIYLDDWLIVGESKEHTNDTRDNFNKALQFLPGLGWLMNDVKWNLVPANSIQFLVVVLDFRRIQYFSGW